MKIKIKYTMIAAAMVIATCSLAQEQRSLSLTEAVELGIKNSKQLKISRAKIDESYALVKQSEQKRLPDVSLSGSYLRLANADIDLKSKSSGGGGASTPAPKVNQAMYGILNAGIPLFAGGRIRYGIESARFLAKAAELDAENDKEEVAQNAVEAYVNLFKAGAAVRLVKENLEEAKQWAKDLSNLEKNGMLARNDLLKAELQVSNIELALSDAENNWQLANVNMDLLLGLPDKTIIVPDSNLVNLQLAVKPLDDYLQTSLSNRKDIVAIDLKKEAAETGMKAVKGEMFPSVQLTGGYIAADIPNMVTITNAANIGVGLSYSIGSLWKNKAKVKEAEARVNQIAATQELMNDRVRLEVHKAYLDYSSSQKKIEVSAKAIEQANENFRIVNNKFNNSLATITDRLDANLAKLQAELNYVLARADAIVAYKQLLQAAGQNQPTK